jgi:hypothetical protein
MNPDLKLRAILYLCGKSHVCRPSDYFHVLEKLWGDGSNQAEIHLTPSQQIG